MGVWMIIGFPIVLLTSVGLAIVMFVFSVSEGKLWWFLLYGIDNLPPSFRQL